MRKEKYYVLVSTTFEKKYKKILARDPEVRTLFALALIVLENNPKIHRTVKKLVGVASGDGAWRVRLGVYRLRYDISGTSVILHTIGHRSDIYRKK